MRPLFWLRLGTVTLSIACCLLIVRRRASAVAAIREFFFRPSIPENLAIFRIYLFGVVLFNACNSRAEWFASLHPYFLALPVGWGWTQGFLLPLMDHIEWLLRLEIVAAALAVLGFFTRPAMVIASLVGLIVFGVPCFYFKVGHGMHVQELCALVLAVSPCGDALSVDSWLRRREPPKERSDAYTIPMRFCWLLIGTN
jgi:hypothetical protein